MSLETRTGTHPGIVLWNLKCLSLWLALSRPCLPPGLATHADPIARCYN